MVCSEQIRDYLQSFHSRLGSFFTVCINSWWPRGPNRRLSHNHCFLKKKSLIHGIIFHFQINADGIENSQSWCETRHKFSSRKTQFHKGGKNAVEWNLRDFFLLQKAGNLYQPGCNRQRWAKAFLIRHITRHFFLWSNTSSYSFVGLDNLLLLLQPVESL